MSFSLFALFFGAGCKKNEIYPSTVNAVLKQAKGNSVELKKALDYFLAQRDTLKIKAIFFLVENMRDKYSIIPEGANDPFQKTILSNWSETEAWEPSKSRIGMAFDSIYQITDVPLKTKIIRDINAITGDYLIANVEKAFEQWEFAKRYAPCSFEDFCEYILPYRIGYEPLSNWRNEACRKFSFLLDSLQNSKEVAKAIVKLSSIHYNAGMNKYPYPITFNELDKLHWGSCDHLAAYLALSLRAIGVASSTDIVPAWANRSSGHVWNVVMNEHGRFEDMGFHSEGGNDILYKIPKIYRTVFSTSQNKRMHYLNPNWKDVTAEYALPVSDIKVNETKKAKGSSSFLCIFNNREWIPVAVSEKEDKDFCLFRYVARGIPFGKHRIAGYENEGKGIVYLPVCMDGKSLNAFSAPVILKEDGDICLLSPDLSHPRKVMLHRKYPKYGHISAYGVRVIGGIFEASGEKDFSRRKIIHIIKNGSTHAISEVDLPQSTACRYVRYIAPDNSWVNLSELQFYGPDGAKHMGRPFSSHPDKTQQDLAAICDNNIDTYYTGEAQNAYVGIDFGKEVCINKIVYAPRTDGNDIIPGEEYELFYWDKKWISLGRKIADNYYLEYDRVPDNALLLLHNHIKGVEERIFTYEKEEQIWW